MIYTANLPQWAETFTTVFGVIIATCIILGLVILAFVYLAGDYKKDKKRKDLEERMNKEIYEYFKRQNEEIKKVDNSND